MWKIRKYFYRYWVSIVGVVLLLFIQAMTNLALPELMANIVDNGIQNQGIVGAIVEVISPTIYDDLLLFVESKDLDVFTNSFTKQSMDSSISKKYKGISGSEVYVRNKMSSSEWNTLEPILSKALVSYYLFSDVGSSIFGSLPQIDALKAQLPSGVSLFEGIRMLEEGQRVQIIEGISTQLDTLQSIEVQQVASLSIKEIYSEMNIDEDTQGLNYIKNIGFEMIYITIIGGIATIFVGLLAAKIAAGLSKDLRKDIFVKISSFSNAEFDQYSTASLITRTSNDITQIQLALVRSIRFVFYAPILGIGAIYKVWSSDTSMLWIIFLTLGIMIIFMGLLFIVALPKFKIIQFLLDKLNLVTRESLNGMLVVRAFGNESIEQERFKEANKEVKDVNIYVNRLLAIMQPLLMFVMNVAVVMIIWFGAKQVDLGTLQIGNMIAFMQYAIQVILAFLFISIVFITLPRATVAAHRIVEVLDTDLSMKEVKEGKTPSTVEGVVSFEDVRFSYPNAQESVLEHISFTAVPGQTTAFIGSTGSGKSTLINLLPRLYDVSSGRICIDGIDLREYETTTLHNVIGYVPQKGFLFSGTIQSNIEFGQEGLRKEELDEISSIAQAKKFIDEKEYGYQENIAQSGNNVSGGQRQRLSIARALAKKAKILIFDDSFSALDFKTDKELREALHEHVQDTTILIVAQRVATILHADQIIVLDAGKIVAKGTHEELMKSCDTYIEISLSQLSKEELAHV